MGKPDIYWEGESGSIYGYWIQAIGTAFKKEPGNYIYARKTSKNNWVAVYIGQTENLHDLLVNHEIEAYANRYGATHVHAHISPRVDHYRLTEEADLIAKWNPVGNEK